MSIHTQADRLAGQAARWVILAVALGFAAGAILGALSPRLATPPSLREVRAWASILAVPRVEAHLSASERAGSEIRRVRLDTAANFRVEDVSDLDERSFAFVDGATSPFQEFEPAEPGNSARLVFKRNPRGRSLFVLCGPRTPCRDLVIVAHRKRLVWALRVTRMPAKNALAAALLLALVIAAAWRWCASARGALLAASLAFAAFFRVRNLAAPLAWSDLPGLLAIACVLILSRPRVLDRTGQIASRLRRQVSASTVDACFGLALIGLGAMVAASQLANGTPLAYYQGQFGPAVNFALGRGFLELSSEEKARNPQLVEFLDGRADSPGPLRLGDPSEAPQLSAFQKAHRYLILCVGWIWKILGLSQFVLFIPWCIAVGFTAAAVFAFAAGFLGRIGGLATSLVFLFAPTTLQMIGYPRDFLKGIFVFLFLTAACRCLQHSRGERSANLWAAGAGLALGVGAGFRMDVLVMAPLFALVLLLRRAAGTSVARPAAAFTVAALLTGGPIVFGLSGGSNSTHVALLGQSPYFDRENGMHAAANQWNAVESYADERIFALSRMAAAVQGVEPPPTPTAEYDRVVGAVWSDQVRWAPADLATRVMQAHSILWDLPVSPENQPQGLPHLLASLRSHWRRWTGWMWLLALTAALFDRSGQCAVGLGAFLIAIATSWLQLSDRHVFHWLPVTVVVQAAAIAWFVSTLARHLRDRSLPRPPAWKVFAIGLAFLAPATGLEMVRQHQTRVRRDLAHRLLALPGVEVTPERTGTGTLRYPGPTTPLSPGSSVYWLLTVEWNRCPSPSVEVRWSSEDGRFVDRYRLFAGPPPRPGASRLLHARAYMFNPTSLFVPDAFATCVRVEDLAPRSDFPVLWSVLLAADWETSGHNLTLADDPITPPDHYSELSLVSEDQGRRLRIGQGGTGAPGKWNVSGKVQQDRVTYDEPQPGAQVFFSPVILAPRSGRYRFEFEIGAPGGEWRAFVNLPAPAEVVELAVGEGSLAHPGALLLRPLRFKRRVVLDEWLDAGEACRLYLRALSSTGTATISGFRVSGAPASPDPSSTMTGSVP